MQTSTKCYVVFDVEDQEIVGVCRHFADAIDLAASYLQEHFADDFSPLPSLKELSTLQGVGIEVLEKDLV